MTHHFALPLALITFTVLLGGTQVAAASPETPSTQKTIDPLDGPPFVTCKAWAIADASTGQITAGDHQDEPRNPASITKIMTALVVMRIAEQSPEVWNETITFSEKADKTSGSTSGLNAGEKVSVTELLYGLLLPSGNDASVALAEHFGKKLTQEKESSYDAFIRTMCETAKDLGMTQTSYRNPHGLTAEGHLTTASDMIKLAREAMKYEKFREIVSTARHSTTVKTPEGGEREVEWKNSNKLLAHAGYLGMKTGTTRAAGACLVSCAERDGQQLIMVVLGSTSSDARYVDTRNLYRWIWNERTQATSVQ
ncbi:D-alanyl-D-alanine carboxypeptidase family protein [Bremerella sp. T1]|uniref:D-alanyl-D-alanine carboxypeptidase family protein n=1 Tax=Bremerella sp. TYQ1 TaxID=3119568 RepID=UPI001CCB4CB5|nr:D-alanyl-D-alanine carboxypeptidase family protein [Bremerella volcania]UBM35229.1 D-alanyl-D-alanine carboxypeptidase [Bremerella volcania]